MKLKVIIIGIGIIISILISGCVEKTQQNNTLNKSSSLFFPVQKNQTDVCMDALLSDKPEKLMLDENGCIRAGGYLLVLPYGFSLSTEGDVIQIIDDTGKPIARVGDKIKMGGGESDSKYISEISTQLPSDRCPGPYFIVCKYGIEAI